VPTLDEGSAATAGDQRPGSGHSSSGDSGGGSGMTAAAMGVGGSVPRLLRWDGAALRLRRWQLPELVREVQALWKVRQRASGREGGDRGGGRCWLWGR